MFIKVRLLKGFSRPLTYKVPENWTKQNLVGKIVRVPIRNRETSALVLNQFAKTQEKFEIREAITIEKFPQDINYDQFINKLAQYHQIPKLHFLQRTRTFLEQANKSVRSTSKKDLEKNNKILKKIKLTQEQQKVTNFLQEKITEQIYQPTVLHGVTGSGKTEVYKKLITHTVELGKSTLLLLPEVTLAIQFEKIMREQLPENIEIHSFHSATTVKNKKIAWKKLLDGAPVLIIGVHIPVLLPIANLGFIIVDEEHETGYQEKKHPKINTKDAAIMRAHINKIPILLGSATPSLPSLYNAKKNNWKFFQLKKRFSGNFPEIKTVYLSDKKIRRNFWISQELENAIYNTLEKQEQAIIFLNRRGFSFFVQCKECSFLFTCPNCSVSLTLHKGGVLNCHYCKYSITMPETCPECSKKEFLKKGIGTQQVVTILEKIFPYARIGRADLDTTTKKKVWQQTMEDFEAGNLDILVGTQTIAKGFHFPRVTLVGILWADLNLHFPVFNATETTLQQLIQVAGRAGRNHEKSKVIVQSMSEHRVFDYLNEIDYLKFYEHEMEKREMLDYPPYGRLVEIELKNNNETFIDREAGNLMLALIHAARQNNFNIDVLGPAQPPVSKIKNTHIRKIYLKGKNISHISKIFTSIDKEIYSSKIFYTPVR